ncbi:uncharacterized protein LOC106057515 [Biomphalaria glabrata]|uniref:Uncharacterized protein LOC106057515 n=1 Tax=Biomphalaria glabrata TaxID=6526 RepID=A0A9U8E2P6_BIOGL|nr:uncharacterized protein LOC106057515 [Biomphalaria glabrata]XP_055888020.1 uncharacterized protein LOC106057515 [Biomphalaria glabrata]
MASSVSRPRTASLKWSRPQSVPHVTVVGQHSLDQDMFITGMPIPILNQDTPRNLNWPLAQPSRKPYECKSTAWRSDIELVEQVCDKITPDLAAFKEMFKFRDPYGNSIVTREGLFLIIKSLVGHVSRDQYDSFLKSINLHWRSWISFDEFVFHLQDKLQTTNGSTIWQSKDNKEDKNLVVQVWSPFSDVPKGLVTLYKKLQTGEINIMSLLPVSCFQEGQIFQHQLKNALRSANVILSDKDLKELWKKLEPDKYGAVLSQKLFAMFDLNNKGLPKFDQNFDHSRLSKSGQNKLQHSHSLDNIYGSLLEDRQGKTRLETTSTNKHSSSVTVSKVDTVELHDNEVEVLGRYDTRSTNSVKQKLTQVTTTTNEVKTTTETTTTTCDGGDNSQLSPYVLKLLQAKKSPPQFNDVVDNLHYKFEETYRNLEAAFKLFDFMNDGYIARIDFRRVLKEFGFDINAIELDTFLKRAGIGVVQGLINYKQFLAKYQSKGDLSLLAKLTQQVNDRKYIETEEILKAEQKGQNVSKMFHFDYIKLHELLKQKDKNNSGIIPLQELRWAVNSVLGILMTDDQFNKLLQKVDKEAVVNNSQVNYETFLDLFKSQPGVWNQHKNGPFVRQKYLLGEITPPTPVLSLVEKSKTWMAPSAEKKIAGHSKLLEIHQKLSKLFTDRFHIFDKNFQDMDRKKSGYMTKWQLGALLKLSGITLSVKDLDVLWASLNTAADDTLSYAVLVKSFVLKNQPSASQKGRPTTSKPSAKATVGSKRKTTPANMSLSQTQAATDSIKDKRSAELIRKIKDDVMSRWDVLMSIFLNKDLNGYSSISVDEMKDICSKMKFSLTSSEVSDLCAMFDIQSNGWFHYLAFLHAVKKQCGESNISPCVFNICTKHLHRKAGPTSMAITIYDFLSELKFMLLSKFKTLRGSFKFFDLNHNGFIEESELKKSLVMLGYHLSDQDFLDIFQVFDCSQSHCISFEDFKKTLLTL